MGFGKRTEKNQSFLDAAKNSAKEIIAFTCLGLMISCGSSSPRTTGDTVKNISQNSAGKNLAMTPFGLKITTQGENSSASFSKDGQKILFVSRGREAHRQSQVYEFDLNALTERRVTFQDGDCGTPIFTEDGKHMIYSSTTDELKERPPILDAAKKTENTSQDSEPEPFEIYKSDLAGAKIERLTQRAGYDGDLFLRPDRPTSAVFAQWKNKKWDQHQINTQTGAQIPLMEKAQFSIENLRLSPKGKYWVWIEKSTVNKSVEVVLAKSNLKKERALTLSDYEIESLTWGNDEVLLASLKLPKEKYFQIYSFDIMSGCLAILIKGKADLYDPKISSDERSVILTAVEDSGKSDVYLKSVGLISPTCL